MTGTVNKLLSEYGRFDEIEGGSPSISVVIPALNEAGSIGSTLKSVYRAIENYRSHGGGDVEVIVSDNGSEDATVQYAETMGAKVVHAYDKGISNARNAGAYAASGDVILFMDADSMLGKDTLTNVKDSVDNGYEGGVVTASSKEFDPVNSIFLGWNELANRFCNKLSPLYRTLGSLVPGTGSTGSIVYVTRGTADYLGEKYGNIYDPSKSTGEDKDMLTKTRKEVGAKMDVISGGAKTSNRRFRGMGPIERAKNQFMAWSGEKEYEPVRTAA